MSLVRLQWRRLALYYSTREKMSERWGVEGLGTHLDLGVRLQAEPLGDGAIVHISIHLAILS